MSVIDELIDRVLEGYASADEVAELATWLEAPANLELFARRAELHADLRRSLRRRSIQANAENECSNISRSADEFLPAVEDEVTSPQPFSAVEDEVTSPQPFSAVEDEVTSPQPFLP